MIFLIIVSSILLGFYIKNQLKDNLIDSYIDKLISITKSKQIPTFVSKKTGYPLLRIIIFVYRIINH